jgi:ESCRT-II complex subunit VPS25
MRLLIWREFEYTFILSFILWEGRLLVFPSCVFRMDRNFPPMFSKQRNAETERRRKEDWIKLIVAWAQERKQTEILVKKEVAGGDLFRNAQIDRHLSLEDAVDILDFAESRGYGEWASGTEKKGEKERFLVLTRTIPEWAALVYKYVDRTGQMGSVLTVHELLEGEETEKEDFYGMDRALFNRILGFLESHNQAKVFTASDPSRAGVKFLKT